MTAPAKNLVEVDAVPELEDNRARRAARINRPKWEPKKWHPVYEEIVLLDCLGYRNTAIAELKGFTVVHISNILNTPQAKIIRQLTLKRMEAKREQTIEQRLEELTHKAMSRMEEALNNDEIAIKNPLGLFDRAITVLKATGKVKEAAPANINNNTMIVSDEAMNKLVAAVKLSDEAKQLNSGLVGIEVELPPAELVSADVPS